VISRFGAAFRIRREDLLMTKALGRDAVCVSLRSKSAPQFGRAWLEMRLAKITKSERSRRFEESRQSIELLILKKGFENLNELLS
jgi:hypothetical protein